MQLTRLHPSEGTHSPRRRIPSEHIWSSGGDGGALRATGRGSGGGPRKPTARPGRSRGRPPRGNGSGAPRTATRRGARPARTGPPGSRSATRGPGPGGNAGSPGRPRPPVTVTEVRRRQGRGRSLRRSGGKTQTQRAPPAPAAPGSGASRQAAARLPARARRDGSRPRPTRGRGGAHTKSRPGRERGARGSPRPPPERGVSAHLLAPVEEALAVGADAEGLLDLLPQALDLGQPAEVVDGLRLGAVDGAHLDPHGSSGRGAGRRDAAAPPLSGCAAVACEAGGEGAGRVPALCSDRRGRVFKSRGTGARFPARRAAGAARKGRGEDGTAEQVRAAMGRAEPPPVSAGRGAARREAPRRG